MKTTIQSLVLMFLGIQLLSFSGVYADDKKVPEQVKEQVIESEKQTPEQEKTESGEASGNVSDCENAQEADVAEGGVDSKDLDKCKELVK